MAEVLESSRPLSQNRSFSAPEVSIARPRWYIYVHAGKFSHRKIFFYYGDTRKIISIFHIPSKTLRAPG
jgi:hypothetical protein